MARRLAKPVHVTDGEGRAHRLSAGSVPAPELAALIRNPYAWEGGTVPTADEVAAPDAQVPAADAGGSQAPAPSAKKPPAKGTGAKATTHRRRLGLTGPSTHPNERAPDEVSDAGGPGR